MEEREDPLDLKGVVYCITNKVNGKRYVGITKNSFSIRYDSKANWDKKVESKHLRFAIDCYGKDQFQITILQHSKTLEELGELEKYYILIYKSDDREFGYNLRDGGLSGYSTGAGFDKEMFLAKAYAIHGDSVDYSKIHYVDYKKTKVLLICKVCNYEFLKTPQAHVWGKAGCQKCSMKRNAGNRTKTLDKFVFEAKILHGEKYDYSKVRYENAATKTEIICNHCKNSFLVSPAAHLSYESGCPRCCHVEAGRTRIVSFPDFKKRAKAKFGEEFVYDEDSYEGVMKILKITHVKCGETFLATGESHLYGLGCDLCHKIRKRQMINSRKRRNKAEIG